MRCTKDSLELVARLRRINRLIPAKGDKPSIENLNLMRQEFHTGEMCCQCLLGEPIVCVDGGVS